METPDFGTPVDAVEFTALPAGSLDAVHVIEACMKVHHVAAVDYTNEDGVHEILDVRPAFIRWNRSHHLVLWWMPTDRDVWHELRLDRIHGAHDTGEEFTPAWP